MPIPPDHSARLAALEAQMDRLLCHLFETGYLTAAEAKAFAGRSVVACPRLLRATASIQ